MKRHLLPWTEINIHVLHLISPAGSDYTPVTTDLTFNSTNAAIPQTVTIPILDDLLLEGSEVFNVTLTSNHSNVTLLPNLTTVTIEDVEGKLKDWLFLTTQWLPLVTDTLKHQHNSKSCFPSYLMQPRIKVCFLCLFVAFLDFLTFLKSNHFFSDTVGLLSTDYRR